MNAAIAELLKDRIAAFSYVDKIAGLVRVIRYERPGGVLVIPVGLDVVDPLQCDESTLLDLVPDQKYRLIVYFEDKGVEMVREKNRRLWTSHLRLVCWVNTMKMNGGSSDIVVQDFLNAVHFGPYNSGFYTGVRHRVEGLAPKGSGLFSSYTYNDAARQYLLPPFDAFGIDIATTYNMDPRCGDPLDPSNVACWAPPTTHRRRNPKDFTCDELTDPITGLTSQQLTDCLNCGGSSMPGIIHKADFAAMLADDVIVPTLQQIVVNDATMDTYYGAPPLTVKGLALAKKYALGVIHVNEGDADEGLDVTLSAAQLHLQLNA